MDRFLAVAGFTFLAVVLGSSCAEPPADGAAPLPPGLSQVPGPGLGARDDIDAADFTADPGGALHVVWRAVVRKSNGAEYAVFYQRGERGGQAWGPPVEIERSLAEPPRIAWAAGSLHVLFGPKLRHFVGDGRGPFREEAPLVPAGRQRAVAFDLLGGDALRVAYLLDVPGAVPAENALELHVVGDRDVMAARFPGSVLQQPAPRLAAGGGRLRLLCALNVEGRSEVPSKGSKTELFEPFGRVLYLSGDGRGAAWTAPVEIASRAGKARPPLVQAVELIAGPGKLTAFYSASGLWAARSGDGAAWSVPVAVAPYQPSISQGSTESGPVAAALTPSGGGALAWIDARFRKSDRRPWNPLGGWPWSDADPLWANNDVFTLDLPEIDEALAGRPVSPRRLTPPLSLARGLRAAGVGDRVIVLWAGRSRVGKQPESAGRPPALFYTEIPGAPRPR